MLNGTNRIRVLNILCLALLLLVLSVPATSRAGGDPSIVWDGSQPPQGVLFYWYEPSFYTGFAPRTQDPSRAHIQLSRGNQLRVTLVLGDDELDNYVDDLLLRADTYQDLLEKKIISLTVNTAYERFVQALEKNGVRELAASRNTLDPAGWRMKSAELMAALNPGRVFPIRMPMERVLEQWYALLRGFGDKGPADKVAWLDAANGLLPGRINLYALSKEQEQLLDECVQLALTGGGAWSKEFAEKTTAFLEAATLGHYPVKDGSIEVVEFTRIYPVGTLQAMVKYKNWKLSSFGVTGIWHLIPRKIGRGQLGMVDYLSPNPGYGFIPLLQYQHATGKYYNAFHNAGVRTQLDSARFVPEEWKHIPGERNPQKTYRNLPQCYELFDIDGNGTPEVMGIRYFLAFAGKGHTPTNAWAQNNRKDFYAWLYGDNVTYNEDDSAVIRETQTCRFVGRKAKEAALFRDQPLYEAEYYPEEIQFYKLHPVDFQAPRGFTFNRELRRLGIGYAVDSKKLFL